MGKKGGGIPDRWADYTNMGHQIPGTRFIAFKVPLKNALLNNLPPSVAAFEPRELLDYCPSLGLVVDLTNTNRYYDPSVFEELNVKYIKLNTEGQTIPKKPVVKKFFSIVENFSEENAGNDKVIGVHCTHGVNRTGYLICRYMIQQLGVPPDQAIADFNSARGHEQERANYLSDLRKAGWLVSNKKGEKLNWSFERDSYLSGPTTTTPPYLPHQSRTRRRSKGGWETSFEEDHQSSQRRISGSYSGERNQSNESGYTPGSSYGWSSYEHEESGKKRRRSARRSSRNLSLTSPTEERQRGLKRTASKMEAGDDDDEYDDDDEGGEGFKSPKFGKLYYEQYFKGQVLPQYDMDFYMKREGGVGPHRYQRGLPAPERKDKRPQRYKYKGPRPFHSPDKQEAAYSSSSRTPNRRATFSPQGGINSNFSVSEDFGSRRNPLSPDNFGESNKSGYGKRRSSQRFQPY